MQNINQYFFFFFNVYRPKKNIEGEGKYSNRKELSPFSNLILILQQGQVGIKVHERKRRLQFEFTTK